MASDLIDYANRAEDAAAGLHRIRDELPRFSTKITAITKELFAISTIVRQIHDAQGGRRYGPSFYRIRDDLDLVFKSLEMTLGVVFDMFARSRDRSIHLAWEDLNHRFEQDEGLEFLLRLKCYRDFFTAQFEVLEGERRDAPDSLRARILDVTEAQGRYLRRFQRRSIDVSAASTPRPRSRPRIRRMETPASPTIFSDEWDIPSQPPPLAPDPPPPLSPTFTSGSSQSMSSSHTSYSSERFHGAPPLVHWAENIFDGRHPTTEYRRPQLDRSTCHGTVEPLAIENLVRDGFQKALEIVFLEDDLGVRLYWRPSDDRARILIMTRTADRQQLYFCQPLTNLKVIRDGSCLQLCRASRNGSYALWARLNFSFHERMVLFYNAFVAMKCQDSRGIAHADLVDTFELDTHEAGALQIFGGKIQHGTMMHALRLFKDRGSGVVRLEASALRGPKKDVPIWTAFVTRISWDPDWAELKPNGVVSLTSLRPAPYVFISRYEPPKDVRTGYYLLPFASGGDARMFMETWVAYCNTDGRRV